MDLRLVYITCADPAQAGRIGRALVEERLAACANVLLGMRSCYRWQGKVEEAEEAVLIAKTTAALVDTLTIRVKALHTYTIPCIVALPLVGGDAAYLAWIADGCGPATGP